MTPGPQGSGVFLRPASLKPVIQARVSIDPSGSRYQLFVVARVRGSVPPRSLISASGWDDAIPAIPKLRSKFQTRHSQTGTGRKNWNRKAPSSIWLLLKITFARCGSNSFQPEINKSTTKIPSLSSFVPSGIFSGIVVFLN